MNLINRVIFNFPPVKHQNFNTSFNNLFLKIKFYILFVNLSSITTNFFTKFKSEIHLFKKNIIIQIVKETSPFGDRLVIAFMEYDLERRNAQWKL